MSDKALTCREAAEIMGIAIGTLYNMRNRREGPPYYQNGRGKVVYRLKEVMHYMNQLRVDPEKDKQSA